MEISQLVQEIQYILAPAIMISSSALLLLGFQNKFSNLADRFRGLNQEKRRLFQKADRTPEEERHLSNLSGQIEYLFRRASHVKNAILLTYGAVVFFTGTSILILFNIYFVRQLYPYIIVTAAIGLSLLFLTALIMLAEARLIFRVLALEKKSCLADVQ